MKPGEPLYESFSEQLERSTPRIYAYEETRSLATALLNFAREDCKSVGVPRLGHYRTGLQRVMNAEGVSVPDGKIYKTLSYEDFSIGEPSVEYENRLLIQTSDTDDSKSRVTNFVDKIFDENPRHKGTFVIFGVTTPKDIPRVTSVEAITFAVVQANSGEAFGFVFRENPNKGKIRPTEGMSDEWGEVRERVGYIDTCSVEAVTQNNEMMAQIRLELEKAKGTFIDKPRSEDVEYVTAIEKAQVFGRTILSRVGLRRAKKTA